MSEKVAPAGENWQQPPPAYPVQAPPPQYQQTPPQPAAYQQPIAGQPGTTVVVSQPGVVVTGPTSFRGDPVRCVCPNCGQTVMSRLDHETGTITWVAMGACCIFGGWLGCCLIPLCIKDLKDVKHSCPNCSTHLGTYDRMK